MNVPTHPLHIILATVGTDGDVFPYLGLGAILRARGYDITLAAPETYRDRARALNLNFSPLASTEDVHEMLADPDLWHPFRSGTMMARWGGPMIARQYEILAALARQPGSVLIANPGLLAGRLLEEKRGVLMASLLLQPGLVQTSTAPPVMPGGITIPPWLPHPLRRFFWLGVDVAGYAIIAPFLNKVRKTMDLPPVRQVFRWWLSPKLVIGLFPDWYAPLQPDYPSQLRLAGFGRFDGAPAELSEDLRAFFQKGPPPIAFTLGTGMTHAASFVRAAVTACERLGARGLLLSKFPRAIPAQLPPNVRHFSFAPFRQLLPHCAALVHHGGIGTTAAALQSACPQLILPLAWDQPDNAARVVKMGAGRSLGPRQRTGAHIASALAQLLTPKFRTRCKAIATQANSENGLERAADWVEELANQHEPKSGAQPPSDRAAQFSTERRTCPNHKNEK